MISSLISSGSGGLVFDVPMWDRFQWEQFSNFHRPVEDVINAGKAKIFSFPDFAGEVFSNFYSGDADRLGKVRPESAWAVRAHEQMWESFEEKTIEYDDEGNETEKTVTRYRLKPEYEEIQRLCKYDRFMAGISSERFLKRVANDLPTPISDLSKDPQKLREEVLALKNLEKMLNEAGKQLDPAQKQRMEKAVSEGKDLVAAMADFEGQLPAERLDQIMQAAAKEALEAIGEIQAELDAFGIGLDAGSGSGGVSAEESAKLSKRIRNSNKLKRIAEMAGRLKQVARKKQRSKVQEARTEIVGIEVGRDLARLAPISLLKLADDDLYSLFAKEYMENSLQLLQFGGKERAGRGPIVVCLDESGSMSGEKELWSKAVCLVMLEIAVKQGRHFRLIHFDGMVQRIDDFPAGKAIDYPKLLSSMESFSGGGTNWELPLTEALKAIDTDAALKKADILLMSDGLARLSDPFVENFKKVAERLKVTTFGILIASTSYGLASVDTVDRISQEMTKIATEILPIASLKDDEGISEVFAI